MKRDDIDALVNTYRKEKADEEDSDDEYEGGAEAFPIPGYLDNDEPGTPLGKGSDVRRVKLIEGQIRGFGILPQPAVCVASSAQHTSTAFCKRWLVCSVDDFFRGVELEVTSIKGTIYARTICAKFAPGYHKWRGNLAEEANSIFFGTGMHDAPLAMNNNGGDKLKRSVGVYGLSFLKEVVRPFVDWPSFNLLVGIVIFANAITIGLETDARVGQPEGAATFSLLWFSLEIVFCTLFLSELSLRIYFHGWKFFATPLPKPIIENKQDGGEPSSMPSSHSVAMWFRTLPLRLKYWNVVDFVIVQISIMDVILTVVGSNANARFVSMLRFVRLLRLVRLVRLFRIFKELWLVANGLINAMKTLLWVCIMILIVCYIGGIFVTLQIGHNDQVYDPYFRQTGWDHEVFFSTVPRSIFTLFQVVTLDQWAEGIARHVVKNQPGMLLFFVVLISIVSFGLLNIIVGVVVENALSTAAKDQNRLKKAKDRDRQNVFNQLREIFEDADVDGSGTLTFEEVRASIQKPEISSKLRMIDFPVDEPQQVFQLLDYDDSGELTIEEFITGCLRMKGTAKSKDLLVAQVALDCMKKHYNDFESELENLQAKLHRLDATARAITDYGERVFLDMRQYRSRHKDADKLGNDVPALSQTLAQAPWDEPEDDFNDRESLIQYMPGSPQNGGGAHFQQIDNGAASGSPLRAAGALGDTFGDSLDTTTETFRGQERLSPQAQAKAIEDAVEAHRARNNIYARGRHRAEVYGNGAGFDPGEMPPDFDLSLNVPQGS